MKRQSELTPSLFKLTNNLYFTTSIILGKVRFINVSNSIRSFVTRHHSSFSATVLVYLDCKDKGVQKTHYAISQKYTQRVIKLLHELFVQLCGIVLCQIISTLKISKISVDNRIELR